MRPGRVEVYRDGLDELRWRYRGPNGRAISRSSRSYRGLRDLSRNLEGSFPGYRLLDQNGCLEGPEWFLWGLEASWQGDDTEAAYLTLPPEVTLGIGMRGHRIRVQVPAGVNLNSRR